MLKVETVPVGSVSVHRTDAFAVAVPTILTGVTPTVRELGVTDPVTSSSDDLNIHAEEDPISYDGLGGSSQSELAFTSHVNPSSAPAFDSAWTNRMDALTAKSQQIIEVRSQRKKTTLRAARILNI